MDEQGQQHGEADKLQGGIGELKIHAHAEGGVLNEEDADAEQRGAEKSPTPSERRLLLARFNIVKGKNRVEVGSGAGRYPCASKRGGNAQPD